MGSKGEPTGQPPGGGTPASRSGGRWGAALSGPPSPPAGGRWARADSDRGVGGRSGLQSFAAAVCARAEAVVIAFERRCHWTQLQPRESDVVHTDDCRITGKLSAPAVRVLTGQFGEQTLKLADAREIRTGAAAPTGSAAAVAAGNMM